MGLQAPDGSSTGIEVCQCKYYTADNVTEALFRQEYEKSVSAEDLFMLFTTTETSNFTLPKNSGIVDAGIGLTTMGRGQTNSSCFIRYLSMTAGRSLSTRRSGKGKVTTTKKL